MSAFHLLRVIALLTVTVWLSACTSLQADKNTFSSPTTIELPALIPLRHLVADVNASGGYSISPDGERMLWVARRGLGPGLFVKNLRTGQLHSYNVPTGGTWARDSRHIVVHLQNKGDENHHVWLLDTDQPDQVPLDLTPFKGAKSFVLQQLSDSNDLIINSNRRDAQVFDLYRYDMAKGDLQLLATNPGQVGIWLVDDVGKLQGRARLEGLQWVFETPAIGHAETWQRRFTVDYFDKVVPIGSSQKQGHWWALSNRGRDKTALVEIDLTSGSERVEHADAEVDISSVLWSRKRQRPLAVSTDPDVQRWHAFDPAVRQALQKLQAANAETKDAASLVLAQQPRIQFGQLNGDERWLNATVLRHDGGEHLLYDLQEQRFEVLGQLGRSRIAKDIALPPQQPIRFKSRDGLTLNGYLIEPIGVPKPYPTVIQVHGGPWTRDVHNDGSPMLAFLSNRGYAVLQVNYRGSGGYGKAFMEAAKGEFARKMHSDLTDAVDALVAQGVIDPQRLAIAGGSYGGYASLVGMTHTPGKFRCAISLVGMSDLASLLSDSPAYWALSKPHWTAYVGDPSSADQRADMKSRSPLYFADKVQGPILLMHGTHDPRVKVDQSERMAEALRRHGKPVELVLFDKAGHGSERWQDTLIGMRKAEDFLATCLGGRSRGFDFFELGAKLF